jgi:predicted esterase
MTSHASSSISPAGAPLDSAPSAPLPAHHITVPRTARYYTIGSFSPKVRDVWVVCHGYGQLASTFAEPFRQLERDDRLIVIPEALSRFYLDTDPPHTANTQVGAIWMTREDRECEIVDIVSYLDALGERMLAQLAEHGVLRETVRIHALGFSQGAPVVSRWAAFGTVPVGHIVAWGGEVPVDVNVRSMVDRRPGLRLDLVYGTSDGYITAERVAAQEAVLVENGIVFRTLPFKGGHALNRAMLRTVFAEG